MIVIGSSPYSRSLGRLQLKSIEVGYHQRQLELLTPPGYQGGAAGSQVYCQPNETDLRLGEKLIQFIIIGIKKSIPYLKIKN